MDITLICKKFNPEKFVKSINKAISGESEGHDWSKLGPLDRPILVITQEDDTIASRQILFGQLYKVDGYCDRDRGTAYPGFGLKALGCMSRNFHPIEDFYLEIIIYWTLFPSYMGNYNEKQHGK